tara:strand:+ start:5492 stop:6481 length:990 start_codon:yes stop_codon:yes gene_type:complete
LAIVADTFTTYLAKGVREDLSDLIADISPTQTPFQSNIGTRSVSNTLFEWQTDSLAAASATASLEGDETTFDAVTATVRLGNVCQINERSFIISGTEQVVEKAGRSSEVGYQAAKAAKELKRNVEKAALGNTGANTGGATTVRTTAGFPAWLKTNTAKNAATVPTWSGSYPSAGTAADMWTFGTATVFLESMLQEVMQECYESGGEPTMLMVSPFNKRKVSGFAGIAESRYSVDGAQPSVIIGAADIYVSDFGNLSVVPNRFFTTYNSSTCDWAFCIDTDEVAIGTLRPYTIDSLAKTGDADKRMALTEWGLQVNNESAHGVVAGITAS